VRDHTDIKIDYKSNITNASARKVKNEDNNVEGIEDFHVLRASENIKNYILN